MPLPRLRGPNRPIKVDSSVYSPMSDERRHFPVSQPVVPSPIKIPVFRQAHQLVLRNRHSRDTLLPGFFLDFRFRNRHLGFLLTEHRDYTRLGALQVQAEQRGILCRMILLLNGSINAGKTTVSQQIKTLLPRTAHVEVDSLHEFVRVDAAGGQAIPLNLQNAAAVTTQLCALRPERRPQLAAATRKTATTF